MIYAGIATIPGREEALKTAINSIYNQVDKIFVALNNYKEIPIWLNREKINPIILDNEKGDAGKFYWVEHVDGVYFSMDDDLIYPKDYVQKTLPHINNYIVTYHGRSFAKFPINSYYNGSAQRFYCLHPSPTTRVQFGGTGVMAFHTENFNLKYEDFKQANMADVFVGIKAREQNVPIYVLAHNKGWLKAYPNIGTTIYNEYRNKDQTQTQIINDSIWNANVST